MPESHATAPCPFAIGVLRPTLCDELTFPRGDRFNLALDAYKLGYFLVDTIEVGPDGAGYDELERFAVRTGAEAFVVRGPVDRARVDELAGQLGVLVHALAPPNC
jgi:hypothetical protein